MAMAQYPKFIVLLSISLMLVGCASHPQFNLDVPLSEASDRATSNEVSDRVIGSNGWAPPLRPAVSAHGSVFYSSTGNTTPYNPDRQRLIFGFQHGLNPGTQEYSQLTGFNLAYSAQSGDIQYRITGYFSDSKFNTADSEGLVDPFLLGVSLDVEKLIPVDRLNFTLGLRVSLSELLFEFENPLIVDYQEIQSDSITAFGLGLPSGIQYNAGAITMEALVIPTVYFHSPLTSVGFNNDIVGVEFNIPVSLGIGFSF